MATLKRNFGSKVKELLLGPSKSTAKMAEERRIIASQKVAGPDRGTVIRRLQSTELKESQHAMQLYCNWLRLQGEEVTERNICDLASELENPETRRTYRQKYPELFRYPPIGSALERMQQTGTFSRYIEMNRNELGATLPKDVMEKLRVRIRDWRHSNATPERIRDELGKDYLLRPYRPVIRDYLNELFPKEKQK